MPNYTIKTGESIYDVSVKIYGDISYSIDLIKLNPDLVNLNNADISGLTIAYEIIEKTDFKPVKVVTESTQKLVTIGENQSVFDLSLQMYGSLDEVFKVISLSGVENLNDNEIKGVTFNYDYVNGIVQNYFNDKNIKIATKNPNSLNYIIDQYGNIIWDYTDDLIY